MNDAGLSPSLSPTFDFAPEHLGFIPNKMKLGPVVFHWATLWVSDSYVKIAWRTWASDFSLTPKIAALILGTCTTGPRSRC